MPRRKPPLTLDAAKWVSIDQALSQIKAAGVGSAWLAARDLYRDLCSGRLKGASRCISGYPERESCEVRPKSFWDDLKFLESDGQVRVRPLSPDPHHMLFGGRWWFFVRRAELDKYYPRVTPAAATKMSERAEDEHERRKPGRRPTHEWKSFVAGILAACKLFDKPVPTAAKMCELVGLEFDWEPDVRTMQKALKKLLP
jgi:hypothetical protein